MQSPQRVAIITHYFEPLNTIQVHRLEAFCRFFRSLEIEVIVFTRFWKPTDVLGVEDTPWHNQDATETTRQDGVIVVRLPLNLGNPTRKWLGGWRFWSKGIGYRIQQLLGRLEHTQDFTYGNESAILKRLLALRPDFLLTSCPMNYTSRMVATTARVLDIPYWLDFRDLHNNDLANPRSDITLHRKIADWLEVRAIRGAIKRAMIVTTISSPFAEIIKSVFGASRVHVMTNGYEQAAFQELSKIPQNREVFQITYLGTLYPKQMHQAWIQGIRDFIQEAGTQHVRLNFLGTRLSNDISAILEAEFPAEALNLTSRMAREEALQIAARSSVLFYPGWLGYKGIYSGKIFEYLGLRRPILLAPGDKDVLDDLMKETQAGITCSTPAAVSETLAAWYKEFKENGRVAYHGKPEVIAKYSREAQMEQAWGRFLGLYNTLPRAQR